MSSDKSSVVSGAVWQAQPAQVAVTDKITVRNLQASVDAGVDVWGRPKKQRALLTVTLSLAKPFDSAAQADALDNSTVHYGILSKAVLAHVDGQAGRVDSGQLANNICNVVQSTTGDTPLASVEVDIFYPKGSMFGDGAGFSLGKASLPEGKTYRQLHLRNVRIPCLIGVNANERQQKQPVIVNIWVDCLAAHRNDDYQKLETTVVEVISGSSFETLESLTTTVIEHLRSDFFTDASDKGSFVRLRIEKPHAVPAADAPVIEIVRRVGV
ncbi:tetrahydrobiopterin biosynthesis enzymes-like protein [Karstenula rhodostoma CBS 690.94]|uniref:dihydroneopterin aldolase n=1 Tax=Karstenula rhodostoma CBS 690.94 TaxID=1392251 RepID=A0A9P4P852_9PLEO|nr:tetrahydrobiopterin biosynthesis enzymes-like protein [Karstenula rhodostoma CBS 690.94]